MTVSDVSLEIPRGHIIAVVGETGSGKTTLANLLGRFYDPTEGSVSMDGIDLRDMKMSDLRKLVGVVTQETILFNDTIAGNISYGSEGASEEAIIDAAKKANAHEFIMGEPDGYDRMAGEKGFVLSGGEKQRIAIAMIGRRQPVPLRIVTHQVRRARVGGNHLVHALHCILDVVRIVTDQGRGKITENR